MPIARYLGIAVVMLLVAAGGKCGADIIRHDRALDRFAAELFDHPLPPGASEVDRHKELGLLEGNGNHCDLRAWIDLDTDLGADAVAAHYGALDGGGAPDLTVTEADANLVRVEIFESHGANPIGWDWRCG